MSLPAHTHCLQLLCLICDLFSPVYPVIIFSYFGDCSGEFVVSLGTGHVANETAIVITFKYNLS